MAKEIKAFNAELIRRAVNRIAEPVIQTLTPMGNNVLFEKDFYSLITNDGATIAKLIDSDDPTEDAIIQMVKYGSLATNNQAGDGTSTTILLTKKLIDQGLEKISKGYKPMLLKQDLEEMRDSLLKSSSKLVTKVTKDKWQDIAMISSSGDKELATNVVEIVDTAGLDGMVFINESRNSKTKITKDTGYIIEEGMFDSALGNIRPGHADYVRPHVVVTDKKLYHIEECKEILERGYEFGVRDMVIIARDFLGEAAGFLVSNHTNEKVPLNILLVKYRTKDNDFTPLYDLATYLGAQVLSEKGGNLKGRLNANHYIPVERVYSIGGKTILVSEKKVNPELTSLIEEVRKKKEEDPNDDASARRLASLTAGTVNIEVGASTGPEMRELIYRYEDAINAVRASIRSGYVVGGGLTLYQATRKLGDFAQKFGEASVRQIVDNCGVEFDPSQYKGNIGYNAKTGKFSDLLQDGVIEPYDVFKYSVTNAVSIAIAILTSGYFITNKKQNGKDRERESNS